MTLEQEPKYQSDWTAGPLGSSLEKTTIFIDGRRMHELKDPRFGTNYISESYPDGSGRRYLISDASVIPPDDYTARLVNMGVTGRSEVEIAFVDMRAGSRTEAVFAPDDKLRINVSTNLDKDTCIDGNFFGRSFAEIQYDPLGQITSIRAKVIDAAVEERERDHTLEVALPTLIDRIKTADPKSNVFRWTPNYDWMVKDMDDEEMVSHIHQTVNKAIKAAIERVFGKEKVEEIEQLLSRVYFERDIVSYIVYWMNKTGNSLEEELARESIDSIITHRADSNIQGFRNEELNYVRVIVLTDASDEGFKFQEKEVAVNGLDSPIKEEILQEGSLGHEDSVVSQDTVISIRRGVKSVFINWIKGGKLDYSLSFPLQFDIDQMRAIAKDPKADFRRLKKLLGVRLSSLV